MYELFIMACLIKDPSTCKNFEVRMLEYSSLMSCERQAPLDATLWATQTHKEDWQIKKWTCGKPGHSA